MLEQMINTYNSLSAANLYLLGFILKNCLYYVIVPHIDNNYLRLTRTSEKRGSKAKVRIWVPSAERKRLVSEGIATLLGPATMLNYNDQYNAGDHFERVIVEQMTGRVWKKDTTPFNVAGDMNLNGQEIQIKLNGGELTNERALQRAML